jgi:Flp pilus assembly protein TadG
MNKTPQKRNPSTSRSLRRDRSGQALVEFSLALVMLVLLVFGLIDFCTAIYEKQLLVNLSREAANLAARGSGISPQQIMANALDAIQQEATPLSLLNSSPSGKVYLTAVTNNGATPPKFYISEQVSSGGLSASSKVGTGVGAQVTTLPSTNLAQVGGTCYIAEVFYAYKPIVPLPVIAGLSNTFYDVAYFQ